MYKILNKNELTKAEQHRQCICCEKDTSSVKKIEFSPNEGQNTSLWICKACLNEIVKHYKDK